MWCFFLFDLSQWFVIVFQCWQSSEIDSLHKIIPHQRSYPYMERQDFLRCWKFKTSPTYELVRIFETLPLPTKQNQDLYFNIYKIRYQGSLILTWIDFNPSMDK